MHHRCGPPFLHPAKLNDQGLLSPDASVQEVSLTLPRLRFRITHGNTAGTQLTVDLVSAGVSSLDDPGDIGVAELISMQPPYAFIGRQRDRAIGIGFRSATLDLSNDTTPPAVMNKCGVGDDWTGLYFPEVRFFISPEGARDFAFEAGARELLIGFGDGDGLWGDFEAALVNQGTGELTLRARFFDAEGNVYSGDATHQSVQLPAITHMVVDVEGGRTPYTRKAKVGSAAEQSGMSFNVDLTAVSPLDIVITVDDSSATPLHATLTLHAEKRVASAKLPVPGDAPAPPLVATLNAPPDTPRIVIASQTASDVLVTTDPPDPTIRWSIDGAAESAAQASLSVPVAPGETHTVRARKPGDTAPSSVDYYFYFDEPQNVQSSNSEELLKNYSNVPGNVWSTPAVSRFGHDRDPGGDDPNTVNARYFDLASPGATITVRGQASFENDLNKDDYNYELACRRAVAARQHIASRFGAKNFVFSDLTPPPDPITKQPQVATWVATSGWTGHGGDAARTWWKTEVGLPPGLSAPDDDAQGTLNRPNAPPVSAHRAEGSARSRAEDTGLVPLGEAQSPRRAQRVDRRGARGRSRFPDGHGTEAVRLRAARRQSAAPGPHACARRTARAGQSRRRHHEIQAAVPVRPGDE